MFSWIRRIHENHKNFADFLKFVLNQRNLSGFQENLKDNFQENLKDNFQKNLKDNFRIAKKQGFFYMLAKVYQNSYADYIFFNKQKVQNNNVTPAVK